jgi:2-polyprenyl-3-methyl-5-hydroxy-6-metoxy-1,4-benzoquinol methylase
MTRAIRHVARTEVIPVRDAVAGQDERLRAVESELLIRHSRVDQLESQIQLLTAQLTTPPYMTDPSALVTTDDLGRPAIGYRDNPGTSDVTAGFQDVFRGPEGFIRDRQRFYVELVRDQSPVVDVGCGRGEFLDLCKEVGIDAVGVDLDAAMVERCRHKGHRAEVADAAEYLESQLQRSLGAVFSAQVVEHVDEPTLLRWLVASRRALRGGGVFIAETVNPHCINAFKTFWVDLTHHVPIFPETLVTLCRLTGFASAYVVFPNGTGKLEEDRTTQGEYAVVARAPLQTQPAASNREGTASHPR